MFNYNTLERDIERLSEEVKERKEASLNTELSEKEIVRRAIEPHIKITDNQGQAADDNSQADEDSILPSYAKDSPQELKLKVEKLIDSVFHNGLDKTVKEARTAGPFVLDAFHDALTDKLYDELKARKLL